MLRGKRALAILLAAILLFALAGCGNSTSTSTQAPTAAPTQATESTPAQATEPSGNEGNTPANETLEIEPMVVRSAYNYSASSLNARTFEYFQERVTELSGGAITFDTYWGASLLGADEALDGIGTGMADFGNGLPVRTPTKTPLGGFSFYFPFRPESLLTAYEVAQSLIEQFPAYAQEPEAYNVKLLSALPTPAMHITSTVPIQSYKDLNGLKIAAAGTDYNVWESVGAVPVSMAGNERYENLQRKIVDASYLDLGSVYADHHYEVAKNITYTSLGALTTTQVWVNMDFWNKLTPEVQQLFTEALDWSIRKYIEDADEYLAEAAKEMEAAGVEFYTLSAEDQAEWAAQMNDLAAEYAQTLEAQGVPGWDFVKTYISLCESYGHVWLRDWGQGS